MFKQDLEEWQEIEREFATYLMRKNIVGIEFSQGKFPDRDIKAWFIKDWVVWWRTFEIKYDKKSDETWNVWFEYMCNWKPSWIYKSKADYLVYKVNWKFYMAYRPKLLIELNNCQKMDLPWWDNNMSRLYVVKKDVFKSIFKEI